MPMHPECRQEDLEKHGFNAAISMFLPMTALEGKREYMSRYYTPELEAEEAAEREQRFLALVEDWAQRRRQAEDAGQAFDEPFPRYPEPAERPEPLWERVVGEGLYRLSCLPGGKYITFGGYHHRRGADLLDWSCRGMWLMCSASGGVCCGGIGNMRGMRFATTAGDGSGGARGPAGGKLPGH